MKTVYMLLKRSQSMISRIIYCLTGDEYTHFSVSVDPGLTEFHSFARLPEANLVYERCLRGASFAVLPKGAIL